MGSLDMSQNKNGIFKYFRYSSRFSRQNFCFTIGPQILRNLILEGLLILRLMLPFPLILAGKHKWMRGEKRPSQMRFVRVRLHINNLNFYFIIPMKYNSHGHSKGCGLSRARRRGFTQPLDRT